MLAQVGGLALLAQHLHPLYSVCPAALKIFALNQSNRATYDNGWFDVKGAQSTWAYYPLI